MLRSLSGLLRYKLDARDGEIGKVKDFYFDDERWRIRYLVADTGKWISGKKVLISPAAFAGEPEWGTRRFPIHLLKEQIKLCPDIDRAKPVSRQMEMTIANYYSWPLYWENEPNYGVYPAVGPVQRKPLEKNAEQVNMHLRSTKVVKGYAIQTEDGKIGHVDDFIVDDQSWDIRFMVVDTRNWLPGRKVLISPRWIHEVDWLGAKVKVDLEKNQIKNSPAYDPLEPVNSKYEEKLYDYYGRPKFYGADQKTTDPAANLKLIDVITRDLEITEPSATVEEAAKRMEVGNVGILPVCEETKLVGVITDRDMVVRCLAQEKNPKKTFIKDIMSDTPVTCLIHESLAEAGRMMEKRKIRRLMVVDENNIFIGILSLGDLAHRSPDQRLAGEVLENVSA